MLVVETVARIRREFFVKGKAIKEIVRELKSRGTPFARCCDRGDRFSTSAGTAPSEAGALGGRP